LALLKRDTDVRRALGDSLNRMHCVAKAKEPINPFYFLLVVVGVVFLITSFAYGMMAWRATQPRRPSIQQARGSDQQHPLLVFLDRHGIALLAGELAVLTVATAAAMGLDQRRSRIAQNGK
jgi:hypothetical protein